MALKHGTIAVPSGITITGAILNRVRKQDTARKIIEMDEDGVFAAGNGKVLAVETKLTIEGKGLSALALPAAGSGAYTAVSPLVDDTEVTDENEGATGFTVNASYETSALDDF